MTTDLSTVDSITPTCTTKMPCVPLQNCRSISHRSNACPKVSVGFTCKTKSHSTYYTFPLLHNTLSGQTQNQKGYHLDDVYLHHHDKTNYGVNNASRDLHMSLVTSKNIMFQL